MKLTEFGRKTLAWFWSAAVLAIVALLAGKLYFTLQHAPSLPWQEALVNILISSGGYYLLYALTSATVFWWMMERRGRPQRTRK